MISKYKKEKSLKKGILEGRAKNVGSENSLYIKKNEFKLLRANASLILFYFSI